MKNKSVIGRVVKTVSHSKFLIALSLVFSVASVVLSLYIPVLAGRAIDGIASAGSVDFGIVIRALVTLAVCGTQSAHLRRTPLKREEQPQKRSVQRTKR